MHDLQMTDPDTAKFCACLRKNAKEQVVTVRKYRTSIFFRIISSSIGLDSNVTDTALNSLFISRACALCGLTARFLSTRGKIIWSCIFQPCDLVRHFPGVAFSVAPWLAVFWRPAQVHVVEQSNLGCDY